MSHTGETITVIGLGANLGDRLAQLRSAASALAAEGLEILARSGVYETPPAGGPPQPDYLNAAVSVRSTESLDRLLERCLAIERRLGRVRDPNERMGPRRIDLDLLWTSGGTHDDPELTVPHPRLRERPFALRPLLDVAPEAHDPHDGTPYAELPVAREPITRVGEL